MKKNFYVCDSYHTGAIADEIKTAFPESRVYTDSTVLSISIVSPEMTFVNFMQKSQTEKSISKDVVNEKIDFFILSAKLISDGSVNVEELKQKYGHPLSKTIAVSTMTYFLEKVASRVDFKEDKDIFLYKDKIISFFSRL